MIWDEMADHRHYFTILLYHGRQFRVIVPEALPGVVEVDVPGRPIGVKSPTPMPTRAAAVEWAEGELEGLYERWGTYEAEQREEREAEMRRRLSERGG
jgi:hypothetical protein